MIGRAMMAARTSRGWLAALRGACADKLMCRVHIRLYTGRSPLALHRCRIVPAVRLLIGGVGVWL